MKKWIAFLLAVACMLSLCACNMDGSVEYVTVYLLTEQLYDNGDSYSCTYDKNGNLTEEIRIYDGMESMHYRYTYDKDGNQIEQSSYKDGKVSGRLTFDYNKDGKLTDKISYVGDTEQERTTYTYGKDGNMTESVYFRRGKEASRTTYAYDQNGNLTVETRFVDGKETSRTTYTYDQNGNQTDIVTVDEYGMETSRKTYTYDENGNLIEKINDQPGGYYRYTYVYENNRMVENHLYYGDELVEHITQQYNDQGDVIYKTIEQIGVVKQLEYEYTYDEYGNITRAKISLNGDLAEDSSYTCTYVAIKMPRERAELLGYI